MSADSLRRSGRLGRNGGYFEIVPVRGFDERAHPREVDGAVDRIQVRLGQLELLQQQLREVRGAVRRDLETHGEPELALR